MPNTGDVVSKMIATLRASEPNLDTSVGTPVRKILDTVAESIAEAYADQHLITYFYDIDQKIDADLEDFVALFGFSRVPAQRAQGVVTFTRPNDRSAQTTIATIPVGTQVAALTDPVIYAQTTVSAMMDPRVLTVEVPVQAMVPGTESNIGAGLISTLVSPTSTISRITNVNPLTGGTVAESDEELRSRFKSTVFRSLAGTEAMYRAVALEVPQDTATAFSRAVTQVNVIGSSVRRREQLSVVSGRASVTLTNAAFIYQDSVIVGTDIDAGTVLTPGVHYTFTASNSTTGADASAVLTSLNATAMPDGFYDVYYEYVPQASRNDPANVRFNQGAVNNRIDVWCNGQKIKQATQSVIMDTTKQFNLVRTSPFYNQKFRMSQSSPIPPNGRVFVPLAFGPVISIPDTISVGGTTYTEGVDYWIVHQDDAFGYTANSYFGIAWMGGRTPPNGSTFSITYNYNSIPREVQDAIDVWRLVGTDARAHSGKQMLLKFNFAITYDRRYDASTVNTQIDAALAQHLYGLGFGASVQASDIIQVVHNVAGVDNVRFLSSGDDATSYAICSMSPFATNTQLSVIQFNGRATDVNFADDVYPVFHSTRIVARGANNFRGNG